MRAHECILTTMNSDLADGLREDLVRAGRAQFSAEAVDAVLALLSKVDSDRMAVATSPSPRSLNPISPRSERASRPRSSTSATC